MRDPALFHRIFVTLFALLLALRLYYHRRARTWERGNLSPEGKLVTWLRLLVGIPGLAVLCVYPFRPQILAWATFSLPDALRWLGAALAALALLLLLWIHRALDRNFSGELRLRPDHTLVTAGPYRYVRHPMYSVFLMTFTGWGLLAANWLIGGVGVVFLLVVMIVRTPREEQMLLDRFGDEYRRYREQTGQFWPRLGAGPR